MDDIKEIKQDVKVLLQQSAVHNELLRTHENRSLALQASQEKLEIKLEPIEKSMYVINMIFKGLGAVAVAVAIHETIHLLFK